MELSKSEIIGLSEKVKLIGKDKSKVVLARIDTGAKISSIDYRIAAELKLGPVTKTKKVKNANGITERPVVKCCFELKGEKYKTDVTLANRDILQFSVLIGQNLLKKTKLYINPRKKTSTKSKK
jgi:hypothetical protein